MWHTIFIFKEHFRMCLDYKILKVLPLLGFRGRQKIMMSPVQIRTLKKKQIVFLKIRVFHIVALNKEMSHGKIKNSESGLKLWRSTWEGSRDLYWVTSDLLFLLKIESKMIK